MAATPEGSRPHDYVIESVLTRYRADGWRTWRPRNRPIPALILDGERVGVLHCPWAPVQATTFIDFDFTHDTGLTGPAEIHARHAAALDVLDRCVQQQRAAGHRIISFYQDRGGFLSIIRPDGLAARNGRVAVIEAHTGSGSLRAKVERYADADEVTLAMIPNGVVFDRHSPPKFRTRTAKRPTLPDDNPPTSGGPSLSSLSKKPVNNEWKVQN